MSFKKNKYEIVRNAISKEEANLIYNYFLNKKRSYDFLMEKRYFSPFEYIYGTYNDPQVPNTYSHYSDLLMDTLLQHVQPMMEKKLNFKLSPTYSYARKYKKNDILKRHKDRFSCEISTTMNLGGDAWPIYLEPNPKLGELINDLYVSQNTKGIKINLNPGDMLIYSGCELEHWREPFTGQDCAQVFLHYNKKGSKKAQENEFDTRPFLGLPAYYKKKESDKK
tara:strand:- start:449 stop:1117 length:669 start_codon:yes stop_codon:yes gene_type:complete